MSDLLNAATPTRARHIRPGQGQAVEMMTGDLLQIQTLQGKQVADFVAFSRDDLDEYLSTAATRSTNANIVPRLETTLYSNRRQPMFEIVEDTVGRHDMLYVCCDPVRYELLGAPPGHANCREALTEALSGYGIGYDRIPDPINWFMNVAIMQRGELEIREPLAEAGDYVLLRALKDVVAAVSACPQEFGATNAGKPTDLAIRVYRSESLQAPEAAAGAAVASETAEAPSEAGEPAPETTGEPASPEERIARRAEQRAERRAERRETATESAANPTPTVAATRDERPAAGVQGPPARSARLRNTAEATVARVENTHPNGRD